MSVSRAKVAVNLCLVGDVTIVFRSVTLVFTARVLRIGGSIQGNRLSKFQFAFILLEVSFAGTFVKRI